jgi:hypothetical protein
MSLEDFVKMICLCHILSLSLSLAGPTKEHGQRDSDGKELGEERKELSEN